MNPPTAPLTGKMQVNYDVTPGTNLGPVPTGSYTNPTNYAQQQLGIANDLRSSGSTSTISVPQSMNTSINAGNIGTTGASPMTMPNVPSGTANMGIIGASEQGTTNSLADASKTTDALLKASDNGANAYNLKVMDAAKAALGMKSKIEASQATANADATMNDTKTLQGLNLAAADEQAYFRSRERQISSTPMTAGQAQAAHDAIRGESAQVLGDLAIKQAAVQGNITLMNSAFDRQTKAMLEPYDTQLTFIKDFQQKYGDTLTAKENQKLALLQTENTRIQTNLKDLQTARAQMFAEVSKNGGSKDTAVMDAIQKATDISGIAQAGSKYIGQMDFLKSQADIAQSKASTALSYANIKKVNKEVQKINDEIKGAQVPNITNPQAGKYSGALSVILGSAKFTKEQKAAVIQAVNNGDDPMAVIKNQAKGVLTGANQTKLENAEAVQSSMQSLKESLNAYYAAGGDTGLIKGNFEKVTNNLGQVNDPALATLAVEVQSQLQSYRNAISGTAYSDQEGKDISSVFPGINKSKVLNDSIFLGRDKSLQSQIDGVYKSVLGSTYESLKTTQPSANDTYAFARAKVPAGEILISRDGQIGSIPASEFNSKTDKKI